MERLGDYSLDTLFKRSLALQLHHYQDIQRHRKIQRDRMTEGLGDRKMVRLRDYSLYTLCFEISLALILHHHKDIQRHRKIQRDRMTEGHGNRKMERLRDKR